MILFVGSGGDRGFAICLQEAFQLFDRERWRQVPSLSAVAAELAQHRQLLLGLDAFRDDTAPHCVRQTDDAVDDRTTARIVSRLTCARCHRRFPG